MRRCATVSLVLVLACHGGTNEDRAPEPAWLAERAGELEPAAYAAAIEAGAKAFTPSTFRAEADASCGGDRIHAVYYGDDDLDLEVTAKDAVDTGAVELRLGGRVAFRAADDPERINSLPEGPPLSGTFRIEHPGRFLRDGSATATLTIACAYRDGGVMFTWGKRRTLTGVTLRLQRPDDALLARVAARQEVSRRLEAEEELLSDQGRGLANVVAEARRWDSVVARRIVTTYDRLHADFEHRRAAFDAAAAAAHDTDGMLAITWATCR